MIFSRNDKMAGKAIRFNVEINGVLGLQLPAGSTVRKPMPVGQHRGNGVG